MSYYKVQYEDNLPMYTSAGSPAEARAKVERLTGPLPKEGTRIREIQRSDIPEGEDLV